MYGVNNHVMHTGVKGMKWGVRNDKPNPQYNSGFDRYRAMALTRRNQATVRRVATPLAFGSAFHILAGVGGVSIFALPGAALGSAIVVNRLLKMHGNKKLAKMYQA